MKRILHVALVGPSYSAAGLMKGFLGAGFSEYFMFDYWLKIYEFGKEKMREMLIQEAERLKPDMIFCQIQSSDILDVDTFKALAKISFVVNYTFDIRSNEHTQWLYDLVPEVGLVCFSNQYDVDECNRRGYQNAMVLQSAADVDVYKPARHERISQQDGIVFVGNNFLNTMMPFPKSKERSDMVEMLLAEWGTYFKVYGMGWYGKVVNPKEEVEVYQNSFIAINQNNFRAPGYTSDRLWRILSTGCFCLTEYFEGIEKMFTNGEELVWWKSLGELKALIGYYIANADISFKIATNGMSAILTRHTWKNRIEEMITFIRSLNKIDPIACATKGAHVIGGVIPESSTNPQDFHDKPCDCGKLRYKYEQCECGNKPWQLRAYENV